MKAREKKKEKQQWWEGAEFMLKKDVSQFKQNRFCQPSPACRTLLNGSGKENNPDDSNKDTARQKQKLAEERKDCIDYSVWEKWAPDDPVSLEEKKKLDDLIEEKEMEAFEEEHADFCSDFRNDMETRRAKERKKQKEVDQLKKQGVRYYRQKQYASAEISFIKALKKAPHREDVLSNLALVSLKQDNYDAVRSPL